MLAAAELPPLHSVAQQNPAKHEIDTQFSLQLPSHHPIYRRITQPKLQGPGAQSRQ